MDGAPQRADGTTPAQEQLDASVDASVAAAIAEAVDHRLEGLATAYLGVLSKQFESLGTHSMEFPQGMPVQLPAGDLESFATHLAEACQRDAREVIAAFNKDGANILEVLQSAYENAPNYTHMVWKRTIRGCNAIYYRGAATYVDEYPELVKTGLSDSVWLARRSALLTLSYAELRRSLEQAASPQKRAIADVVPFCEEVDDAVWQRTELFERCFLPVLRQQLAEPSRDWRSNPLFRETITPTYVRWVVPNKPATLDDALAEDLAFAHMCFHAHVENLRQEFESSLPDQLVERAPLGGSQGELAPQFREIVRSAIQRNCASLTELGLRLARERADVLAA